MPERSGRAALIAAHIGLGIVFFGALALVFGYFVMLLWNGVVADVLAVRRLTYWQGVGLLVLCRLLVGGLHAGHHSHRRGAGPAQQRRESALGAFIEHGRNRQ
jgi:hypothetical protein